MQSAALRSLDVATEGSARNAATGSPEDRNEGRSVEIRGLMVSAPSGVARINRLTVGVRTMISSSSLWVITVSAGSDADDCIVPTDRVIVIASVINRQTEVFASVVNNISVLLL